MKSHSLLCAVLVVYIFFGFLPPFTHATLCAPYKDIVRRSDVVFSGTVIGYNQERSDETGRVAIISVDTIWKGNIDKTVQVQESSVESVGMLGQVELHEGKRYIIAANDESSEEIFHAQICETGRIDNQESYNYYVGIIGPGRSTTSQEKPSQLVMKKFIVVFVVVVGASGWLFLRKRHHFKKK